MTALETRPQNMALAQPGDFSREQIDLIKNTVAVGCNDLELALFLEVCKSTGLSPFQRQVYAIKRKSGREDKMTIQTGIDGYRLIASRTGTHLGTSDTEFGPLTKDGYPEWARVIVRRLVQGHIAEFPATARWSEYVQTKDEWVNSQRTGKKIVGDMWSKMPHTMLGKCSEALALRKAFPAELSGVYSDVEMQQADNSAPAPQPTQPRTVDITREVQQATNPYEAALQAWTDKISEAGTKISSLGGRERAAATLAHYPNWRKDTDQAKAAFEALCELGVKIKKEQEEDVPPFDVVSSVYVINSAQLKVLQAHVGRVLPRAESEQRHAFYHWFRPLDVPTMTKTNDLTEAQAQALIDALSGLDNDAAQQTGAAFLREFTKGLLE